MISSTLLSSLLLFSSCIILTAQLTGATPVDEATTTTQDPTLASVENPCASKFKEDPKRINVSETCVERIGLKPEDMPKSEDEFVKSGYDDKCYGKCLLTELGMLKDLKFEKDAIKSDILEHVVDKEFQDKITEYTLKCLEDAEKSLGPVTSENVCKVSANLLYCCKKEEQKLVC